MATKLLKLFYAYAHEDETLRNQLDTHLSILQRQKVIEGWHDKDITAGSLWQKEIDTHLKEADIILLLVSADFMGSDYCYEVEMTEALKRQAAGEARVIPIILRPCVWESSPLGELQALPKDAKAVTVWPNRDAAFTDIAKGIRKAIKELSGEGLEASPQTSRDQKTRSKSGEGSRKRGMARTPATISAIVLKKAIHEYNDALKRYKAVADYEMGLRPAFQNLLDGMAKYASWTLAVEKTKGKVRPDGIFLDEFNLKRGYWEAKGPEGNLEKEIAQKIANGYPLTNIIFENTTTAILYQNKKRVPVEFDLRNTNDVSDLLQQFFTYVEPDIENFEEAVEEFKTRIPELARAVLAIIQQEHKANRRFQTAFESFAMLCRSSLDPKISNETIDEMLVQHLLTERLFRTVFGNPDFINRNVIAAEIEKVIQALASRSFNRQEFLKGLDRFYVAIEGAAKGIESWSERQHFLNTVYERFFQGFSVKQADVHGIVYTPQEIVDFMCASVEEVLQREFGTSIAEPGVQILDPATGTGSFIVNMLHRIPSYRLKHKYQHDLFCNEITLLPYYIASLNIEHEYYERMGEYEPFEGICFADTLELTDSQQLSLFVEENTERIKREREAQIVVVLGNPPYNAKQTNESDNNKNRRYPLIDQSIRETYAKDSKASSKIALSDAYVKFFRWATDRLAGHDGIICLVTNNSFIDQIAFDGMRKHLLRDFNYIYHLDLHGNVRKNPKLSGTTHNVFGIQVGVGITLAIRLSNQANRKLFYFRVPNEWKKREKLNFLVERKSIKTIAWQELHPNDKYLWITEGIHSEFTTFLPVGAKEAKLGRLADISTVFKNYGRGVATGRDNWVYSFDQQALIGIIKRFIGVYNTEVDRWLRRGNSSIEVDSFVDYKDLRLKWSESLKLNLQRSQYAGYSESRLRIAMYRPFCKRWLFFDRILNERVYQFPTFFPERITKNWVICFNGVGAIKPFHCLVTDCIIDLNFYSDPVQCFPYYVFSEDGTNRRENITDWALKQFQEKYGSQVTKWDIFHYVYGMLHHPQYRERYAENLKRDLPHIPLLKRQEAFEACVRIGKQLMDWHLNYEQAKEYPLEWLEKDDVPFSWHVEKMRLSTDKRVVVVNESLRLGPLPEECFQYRLGNRSALDWVIDQYQVTKDKRSGIESDPNQEDEQYIVRLVGRVVTVSVETVKLVGELAQAVTLEDWLDETVEEKEA